MKKFEPMETTKSFKQRVKTQREYERKFKGKDDGKTDSSRPVRADSQRVDKA